MEYPTIHAAFGYHPEQKLPKEAEMMDMLAFIEKYNEEMIAVGEVGLPYYTRKKDPSIELEPYEEMLELFIEQAKLFEKPIILHAVYEDAQNVCDLLENHEIKKAHFHWFKGNKAIVDRMKNNGYFISITPDILYDREIKEIVKNYPLSLMMVETDGPWQFEGPFENHFTHPKMLHNIVEQIALIKKYDLKDTYTTLLKNTKYFYQI